MNTQPTLRQRFASALAGEPISQPIYAVYDWFVQHRPQVDWDTLLAQGLGIIGHADLLSIELPNAQINETLTETDHGLRRDVHWLTDQGELHEWYLGEWRQEYLIKQPADYRIMARALSGRKARLAPEMYRQKAAFVDERGITLGQMNRTPLQAVQIDMAGLERFSLDLADECPALMNLLDLMSDQLLEDMRLVSGGPAQYIKLWENLSIETMGPACFRRRLAPLYRRIFDILNPAGKRLVVHFDGKLRCIADQIAGLDFDGIDSFTQAPEGDMSVAEARACWPDMFLWVQANLDWYMYPQAELASRVRQVVHDAGPRKYCLMISEDVPNDCMHSVPAILNILSTLG
jgi:hypothetical protein